MAISTLITNFQGPLKRLYRDSNVEKLTFRTRPLLGMLNKFEGFGGESMQIVPLYGNPQGISRTFATAQTNRTQVLTERFFLTRVNQYAVSSIGGEVIEATRNNNGAFLSALKTCIDTTYAGLADKIESLLFRSGTGSLAQVGSISTTTLTLAQTEGDPVFEIGMELVASAADGGTLRTGSATITGMNFSDGSLITDSNWTTQITSLAAGDYLYVEGDAQAGASASSTFSGLESWVPSTAPSSGESFFGVDRSDKPRLYGIYHDGSSESLEHGAIIGQSKAAKQGGSPDTYILHHSQYRRFILEVESKKEFTSVNARNKKGMIANIAYEALVVHGDHGPINVMAANKCPVTTGFMLTKWVWTFNTLGKSTKIMMEDGNKILRQANEDGYEIRMVCRGNPSCKAPVWNANIALPNPV